MNPNVLTAYIRSCRSSILFDLAMLACCSWAYNISFVGEDYERDIGILATMYWTGAFVYDLGDALKAFFWWNDLQKEKESIS